MIKNNPCNLLLHPDDATKLKLNGSENVKVSSKAGEITIPYETTEEIMKGTVSLPHG